MDAVETGISKKWIPIARSWLGNSQGKHCHWCKKIKHNDGYSHCKEKQSPYYDIRIRTWDGGDCAHACGFFELSDYYKDDINYYKSFPKPKSPAKHSTKGKK